MVAALVARVKLLIYDLWLTHDLNPPSPLLRPPPPPPHPTPKWGKGPTYFLISFFHVWMLFAIYFCLGVSFDARSMKCGIGSELLRRASIFTGVPLLTRLMTQGYSGVTGRFVRRDGRDPSTLAPILPVSSFLQVNGGRVFERRNDRSRGALFRNDFLICSVSERKKMGREFSKTLLFYTVEQYWYTYHIIVVRQYLYHEWREL